MKPIVYVVSDTLPDISIEVEKLSGIADVHAVAAATEPELLPRVADAAAIIINCTTPVRAATLRQLKQCKLIVRGGVGVDNVDLKVARELNIAVANVPDYGTEEVADSTLGLILALTRGIASYNAMLQRGGVEWTFRLLAPLHRLRGKTLGIVGLGRIGTAVALRAKAFGLQVAYFDPYKPLGMDKALGIAHCGTLEALLARTNILTLHCPLTAETKHLINSTTLAQMPRGGILINAARGAVLDVPAALQALEQGQLSGLGIDVLPEEPPSPSDPLIRAWKDPNHIAHSRALLNPHAAFYCEEGQVEIRVKAARACEMAVTDRPIPNVVNNL